MALGANKTPYRDGTTHIVLEPLDFLVRLAALTALEAPLMLVAIIVSARFVVRRLPAILRTEYIVSGEVALLLLVLFEFFVVLGIRAMPWLLAGRR